MQENGMTTIKVFTNNPIASSLYQQAGFYVVSEEPIEEQIAIVSYIEGKVKKVNSLINELESEIEFLREYKQKLIADCVTGQINVQSEI